MIRLAHQADANWIVPLLSDLYASHEKVYGVPFDPVSAGRTVRLIIKEGVCLVGKGCCAGAIHSPYPWNHQVTEWTVVFWAFKGHRIGILKHLMNLIEQTDPGAIISAASQFPDNRIGKHYQKLGFSPVETHHVARCR